MRPSLIVIPSPSFDDHLCVCDCFDPTVDAPQAVLAVPDEGQPRGAIGSGAAWPIVLREHAAHDIFVDVDAEVMRDLLGDAYTAEPGVAALQLDDRRDEFCRGTFGARFAATVAGGKEQATFCDRPVPCGT